MTTDLANRLSPRRGRARRPRRLRAKPKPPLRIIQILVWADAHFKRTGSWPKSTDGHIRDAWQETWQSVDKALLLGRRGLLAGSSLARLLHERRGVRNHRSLPSHSVPRILEWADAHRAITGRWPKDDSGPVIGADGETWSAVESALRAGMRGLPGGSSLARLLATYRGVRNRQALPRLTIPSILSWADRHFERTGRWPMSRHEAIPESPGDDWQAINVCLRQGCRGLPGGKTLAQLLDERRDVRNRRAIPQYTERKILSWADAHYRRTGSWPRLYSGAVIDAPGETWQAINTALSRGTRGLPGGSSLAKLLQRRRGVRHKQALPNFRVREILAWAHAHRLRTGEFPSRDSGRVAESPGDTWLAVEMALRRGRRGLSGSSTLARLLKAPRRVPTGGIPSGRVRAGSRSRGLATK